MIIASLGEALGLIGLLAVVMLYMLLFTRGFRAALGIRDSSLLANWIIAALLLRISDAARRPHRPGPLPTRLEETMSTPVR